ncbi:MAG: MBL fold metallo-hydrolase [Clostridia bacterium]
MNIYPLFSSSKGNSFCLEYNNTNILIDVGVSYSKIIKGLNNINKNISDIDAILITHEHTDHIKGLEVLCKKNTIPIYSTYKTCECLTVENTFGFNYEDKFNINELTIELFKTSHDAIMPCGFYIVSPTSSFTFATDLR